MNRTHGHSTSNAGRPSPTYYSWSAMITRCTRPSHPAFARYGGRGISVCERWLTFVNFLSDMGERPSGKSLERIDNGRGYEPGNVRWATPLEQQNNTAWNRRLTIGSQTMTIAQWARQFGLGDSTVRERLRHGWNPEAAVSTPTGRKACRRGHPWAENARMNGNGAHVCRICERIYLRIRRGWDPNRALAAPKGARRQNREE